MTGREKIRIANMKKVFAELTAMVSKDPLLIAECEYEVAMLEESLAKATGKYEPFDWSSYPKSG